MYSMNRIENNDMELTRQKWVNEGGVYFPISGDTVLLRTPGKGVFNVVKSQNPMDARLGLQKIGDSFEFNFKIYELGCEEMLQTISKTWESEVFVRGEKNLGVIFNGLKGTGKTLSAKLLCNALDLPVVIVFCCEKRTIHHCIAGCWFLDRQASLAIYLKITLKVLMREHQGFLFKTLHTHYGEWRVGCLLLYDIRLTHIHLLYQRGTEFIEFLVQRLLFAFVEGRVGTTVLFEEVIEDIL